MHYAYKQTMINLIGTRYSNHRIDTTVILFFSVSDDEECETSKDDVLHLRIIIHDDRHLKIDR